MFFCMKHWIAASIVMSLGAVAAQDEPAEAVAVADVADAIPAAVNALPEPELTQVADGVRLAVSTTDERAQKHVLLGLNHLHGGWEIEASRHFAAALRMDPDCLLAHWGMVMALLAPSPETNPARNAALDRLLALVDAGAGTGLERGYAYGLIKYVEEGPTSAASAFRKVAAEYPNDIQAAIFGALFGRGGYDEFGNATHAQEVSERALEALVAKLPDNPAPLNALLMARAEAPDLRESLPLARRLVELAPSYPPYHHLLGHYEWRCGEHRRAAAAFARAASLYSDWMKQNDAGAADSPGWVIAECYRIVALASKGNFQESYAAARQVAATPFPADRAASAGGRLLMWEAKTLPARILLRRGLPGNTAEGLASLPDPKEIEPFHDRSLAYWWIDGLRFTLETKRLIESGDLEKARETAAALATHGERMVQTQAAANALGERSPWTRAFRGLEVLASEIQGHLSLAGPPAGRGSAFNWFRSAADRQQPASMLYPPAILVPMASRLGDYHLLEDRPADAVKAFTEALHRFPNDADALEGLKRAAELAGLPELAAEAAAKIEAQAGPAAEEEGPPEGP
jgi:tetratricopeptide (TPR) repeat protein